MTTPTKPLCTLALILAIGLMPALAVAQTPGLPSGDGIQPVVVPGNPTCPSLGYDFGFKPQPEPPPDSTYTFPSTSFTVTIDADGAAPGYTHFDWTSTLGIDAVIVKAGNQANVYAYDPEDFGDTSLHSPINPNNNQPYAVSHIEFCYDFEVDVEKDAETSYERTHEWTITKTATPDELDIFSGESKSASYDVTVTNTGFTDSDWAVSGGIRIENNTPFEATLEGVSDAISGLGPVAVDCGVAFPHVLPIGQFLHCTYSTPLPDGSDRVNTATVETSGIVGGGEATADVTFGDPTEEINDSINVTDSNVVNPLGSCDIDTDPCTFEYNLEFTCDEDEGSNPNTATITETGQTADEAVTVTCHSLDVSKTVEPGSEIDFIRSYVWSIDKTANVTEITLTPGQQFQVDYTVTVDVGDGISIFSDSYTVEGTITVENNTPLDATIQGVSDDLVVTGGTVAAMEIDCGTTFPTVLLAGETLNCTYTATVEGTVEENGTNTATATLESGSAFASLGVEVAFVEANMVEEDECIDVSDTNLLIPLGTVCADAPPPVDFNYSLFFGQHPDADVQLDCGETPHVNIASFVTNDTGATGEDDHTVTATVNCDVGCTLTQGYWKTHNPTFHGGAPHDDTWLLILDDAENTDFFLSEQTWFEVFWTPPKGNAYYNLAHQYMAAVLNTLNGAGVPADVQAALDAATDLFGINTPDDIAGLKGKNGKAERQVWIDLAGTLGSYNEGDIGPGHCDEDGNSPSPRVATAGDPIETLEVTTVDAAEAETGAVEATTAEAAKAEANEPEAFETVAEIPAEFSITNYPNPFNPATTLRLEMPEAAHVRLTVYDVLGRVVARLANGTMAAGVHTVTWNASGLPSGTYFYVIDAGTFKQTGNMVLTK